MTMAFPPERPHSGDLDRAVAAVRVLEAAGLGRLDWVGPAWIDVLAGIDRKSLDYLSHSIGQNTRLLRELRGATSRTELQNLQMEAIRSGLADYARVSGKPASVNLKFIADCIQDKTGGQAVIG